MFVEQGGIGLPDESYFREERFAGIRTAYNAHLERMFGLAQLDDPADRAVRVFDLETAIAAAHWDNVASRDSEKTYNLTGWNDVVDASSVDLNRLARRHGRSRPRVRRAGRARSPRSSPASARCSPKTGSPPGRTGWPGR